jgi:hypothetical protein
MLNVSNDHQQHSTFLKLKWYTMKKVRNERQNFLNSEHDYNEQYDMFLILQWHITYKLQKKY